MLNVPSSLCGDLCADMCGVPHMLPALAGPEPDHLRQTLAALLAHRGVSPTVARKLMRHSGIRLTINTYTHLELADTAGAGLVGV